MQLKRLRDLIFLLTFCSLSILPRQIFGEDSEEIAGTFACADSVNVMDCIEKTKPSAPPAPQPEVTPFNGLQQWANYGPLSMGVRYDTDLGWIPEIGYVQIFYDNGINLQFDYGANEQRANITLGHSFTPNQQIKITYEYLAQNLAFDFASGSVNEWVSQNALGAAYQFLFANDLFHGVSLNGYYIHANSKDLNDVVFYPDNDPRFNLRHIAGGTEETITSEIILTPYRQLLINLGGGYSHLVYNTEYEDNQDTATFAYTAGLDYLLTQYTKFSASIANSAAEIDNNIKISQIFPAHIEAAVTGQYSQGQAGQPNSTSITLSLSYPVITYGMLPNGSIGSLKSWVEKPVVRAPRVLAIKDEQVLKYSIDATNPPAQAVQTGQLIQEIHTQEIFNFDPSLFDKVEYSLAIANSGNSSTPQSQLLIDIKPDGSSPYNAIIYSTAPMPNSATPNGGANTYHVVITALGYKAGLTKPVQSQADLELDVNFSSNNEPQWDKSKTTGTMAFDQNSIPSSVNLNNYLAANTSQQGVKFSFVGSYPYWDLQTDSSGTWYLIRKPDANGAFYAGDIGGAPQPITLSVKYANDPDGTPGIQQKISMTVAPDKNITFAWINSSACQINGGTPMPAVQPNDQAYTLSLSPCIQYIDSTGSVLKVINDAISYSLTNPPNYPNSQPGGSGLKISGNTLTAYGPTGGLGNQYNVSFNIKSAAQGGSNGLPLTADNLIQIGNTITVKAGSGNLSTFKDGPTFITSLTVDSLNPSGSYQITASDQVTNMMECSGKITLDSSYTTCGAQPLVLNQALPSKPDSNGQVSIMWWSSTGFPTVSSITLSAK